MKTGAAPGSLGTGRGRDNFDTYALSEFLRCVESGRVPKGSSLIVENLDRLTRESEVKALNLFTSILLAGVNIVQLEPREQTFTIGSDLSALLPAIIELSRGHSESAVKSYRSGESWAGKRAAARSGKKTKMRLPGWLTWNAAEGRPEINPEKEPTVQRVFELLVHCT